jgi:hypothetical protein
MKKLILLSLCAGLSGCARYDMQLTNGMRITNVKKPVVNKSAGVVEYTDAAGHKMTVSMARVVEIEPHKKQKFISPTEQ